MEESIALGVNDLRQHIVSFGIDVYPPVEIQSERTRLNLFHEEARQRWSSLFDSLLQSDTEFRISKEFRKQSEVAGFACKVDTFVLTNRGPVFTFPLLLHEPIGETGLESTYLDDFRNLVQLFFGVVTKRSVMRIGLVRKLLFATGGTNCQEFLTDRTHFANASLIGGRLELKFRDEKYNHSLLVEPVRMTKTVQLAVGTKVDEPAGYGVQVQLDINNSDVQRPLNESEIEEVLERASSIWPTKLLEFLEELPRRKSS